MAPPALRRLALAILEDAAQTLGPGVAAEAAHDRHINRRRTLCWLDKGNVGGVTFAECCAWLRMRPERMRELLLRSAEARKTSMRSRRWTSARDPNPNDYRNSAHALQGADQ